MDLMTADIVDEIRFQLPMRIGQRYGRIPDGMVDASHISKKTRVKITLNIQTQGIITSVTSPTHVDFIFTPYTASRGKSSRRRGTAVYSSTEYLSGDFVLIIRADGLDRPRCIAERHPGNPRSVAMQLTMVPKFDLPPVSKQEYIFLLDRSGSMGMGTNRIEMAKLTLHLLLRSLPGQGTTFNVFWFNNSTDKLWESSRDYNQQTLDQAVSNLLYPLFSS